MSKACAVMLAVALGASLGCSSGGLGRRGTSTKPSAARAPSPLAAVKTGMSPAQVESLAGKPLAVECQGAEEPEEHWYYDSGVVILRDDKVVFYFPAPAREL